MIVFVLSHSLVKTKEENHSPLCPISVNLRANTKTGKRKAPPESFPAPTVRRRIKEINIFSKLMFDFKFFKLTHVSLCSLPQAGGEFRKNIPIS